MKLTKEQVLKELPYLERADLEAIHAMSGHLLGAATGAVEPQAGAPSQKLFNALVTTLGAAIPYSGLPPTVAAQFEKRVPAFIKFLDTNFKGWDANKLVETAFLRMLFDLLLHDLKDRGLTPGPKLLVLSMPRISEVFDNAFPGYMASGLAGSILKRFKVAYHGG